MEQVFGKKVEVVIKDGFSVVGYISKMFDDTYFKVFSLELPTPIVVHRSWIVNEQIFLPFKFASWVVNQFDQLPMSYSYDA